MYKTTQFIKVLFIKDHIIIQQSLSRLWYFLANGIKNFLSLTRNISETLIYISQVYCFHPRNLEELLAKLIIMMLLP